MRLNVPALTDLPPHFVAGLGELCGPFHNLLIELTGKPLAFALLAGISGHILKGWLWEVLQKTLKNDEKL